MSKQKLELTWVGKDVRPRLEPRILLEDPEQSYLAPHRVSEGDLFDNRLIFGDNLLALKALEQELAGKVKCIFIDPPYNTGSAFEHYDDGLEHSLWLSMMRDRLEILRTMLSEDGSIWITLDDNEVHYLKVLMDEVFGRPNFVVNAIWQKKFSPANDSKWLSDNHDHILIYAKDKAIWRPNLLSRSKKQDKNFKNPDNDPRGAWISADYSSNKSASERPSLYYAIIQPNTGEEIWPSRARVWSYSKERHEQNVRENLVWWGKDGTNPVPRLKKFVGELRPGTVPVTVWLHEEVGNTQEAKKEVTIFNPDNPFATPKPERLLERIIHIATNPGDLVLDSFAGSGTTGAVAHKMGRRWVMVELQQTAYTHIVPRLRKVIDGSDQGGISEGVGWKGGGGFRFYKLAPSLLARDKWENWVINPAYNAAMLSEALCKLEGFTYSPSDTEYWMQGYSTERDFFYATTQHLTLEQLQSVSDEVGAERSLLIICSAYSADPAMFPNLTIKKIPQAVLNKCEWGKDDYSLKVENLPKAPSPAEQAALVLSAKPPKPPKDRGMDSLFDLEGSG
ncbi:MAG: site-specific DNA-methyltransferase [Thermaceae bacterium]|nr:site-specific DNA-methyltransferase [Thermaceae bacterium]